MTITGDTVLTNGVAARLMQVNISSVNMWITQGRLVAFRTPGGHRRLRARELVRFMEQYEMPIPNELRMAVTSE